MYKCAQLSIAKTYFCDNHTVTWTSVALNCFSSNTLSSTGRGPCEIAVPEECRALYLEYRVGWHHMMLNGRCVLEEGWPMYYDSVFLFTLTPQTQKLLRSKLTAHVYDPIHPKNLWRHIVSHSSQRTVRNCKLPESVLVKVKKGNCNKFEPIPPNPGLWLAKKKQNCKRFNNPTSTAIK